MSIIQDIREKYAKVTVVVIAVALVGFILTDYFSSQGRTSGGGGTNTIGSVNGKSIPVDLFARKVDQAENNFKSNGYPPEMARTQALSAVWDQEVNNMVLNAETDKLGMKIGKKELGDILYGSGMPADLKQQLTDESGMYDPIRAKQTIDARYSDKNTTQEWKDNFDSYVADLKQSRLTNKYIALLVNSTNYPRWFLEKQNADNSQIGKISLVRESYASIVDSTVKVEDKEISDYISKHKDEFKQTESRSISYVTFNAAPTTGDSAAIRSELLKKKPEFDTTNDAVSFLARNGETNFFDGYVSDTQMMVAAKKDIQSLAKNQVFGPYLDGNSYVLAKMLETRILPDSVKCRHILLGTQDRNGQPIMPDSIAKAKADSVALAISRGANFDTLETRYTTDQAAHATKGVMTFSSTQIQGEGFAKDFGKFILFDGKVGEKKVIKTEFGWHYIEILSHIKPRPHFKVAYLAEKIYASPQTIDSAQSEALQFAADSRDVKTFDESFEKTQKPKNRTKRVATNIGPNDAQIAGLGFSRQIVRNIYNAKSGEVLKPEQLNDEFVVAVVTGVFKEGTKSPAVVRAEGGRAMQYLLNKKKGEMLKQKVGKITTLEAAAVALGGKTIETIDSVRMNSTGTLGYEPKVSGATFNPANKGKVVPEALAGQSGIYVIRVETVAATPVTTGDVAEQRKGLYEQTVQFFNGQQGQQSAAFPLNALKKAATIKDKRAETF